MLVTTDHVAQVVNALWGFEPVIANECVRFQLLNQGRTVDVIMSIETSDSLVPESEIVQAIRLGFFFTDKDGEPLDFTSRGLPDTLALLYGLQDIVRWGSLKVCGGPETLEVYLACIQQVTHKELQQFCANDSSCPLVDTIMFMAEEWQQLQGVLEGFCRGELTHYDDVALALMCPAGTS